MTGRATFGDFLWRAHLELDAGAEAGRGAALEDLREIMRALARMVGVLGRVPTT